MMIGCDVSVLGVVVMRICRLMFMMKGKYGLKVLYYLLGILEGMVV